MENPVKKCIGDTPRQEVVDRINSLIKTYELDCSPVDIKRLHVWVHRGKVPPERALLFSKALDLDPHQIRPDIWVIPPQP